MIQHSKSLFLSLLIHSALFATLFIIYEYISQKIETLDEKRVCINLKTIHSQIQTQHIKTNVEKVQKKIEAVKPLPLVASIQKEEIDEQPKQEITQNETHEVHATHETMKKVTPKKECEKPQDKNSYVENNIAKIAQLIQENLYYPRRARKRGIEGTVKVKFYLHKDATVSQVSVIASNSAILSRSAIKTITDLSGAFPKPLNELTLTVPISYSLH